MWKTFEDCPLYDEMNVGWHRVRSFDDELHGFIFERPNSKSPFIWRVRDGKQPVQSRYKQGASSTVEEAEAAAERAAREVLIDTRNATTASAI